MRLRRLTLTLPARMRHSAPQDARRIAEAVAQSLHAQTGTPPSQIRLELQGQHKPATHLSHDVARATRDALSGKPGRR